ncbi:hypothetical protein [Staphylococcus simulans]|uniref:hypothetical protein n=1 Tax=Staphylococcus simulans TaxID=1286 RepID=UPI0028A47E1C|nr:hypothetical protein [Staphylococcus simulans]MDT4011629.1 hypothetical protein [Staphylococcus simulans]
MFEYEDNRDELIAIIHDVYNKYGPLIEFKAYRPKKDGTNYIRGEGPVDVMAVNIKITWEVAQ